MNAREVKSRGRPGGLSVWEFNTPFGKSDCACLYIYRHRRKSGQGSIYGSNRTEGSAARPSLKGAKRAAKCDIKKCRHVKSGDFGKEGAPMPVYRAFGVGGAAFGRVAARSDLGSNLGSDLGSDLGVSPCG